MKKGLLTMLALLSMGSSVFAQGTVNVPTVVRKAGEVKEVSVVASRQAKVKIELTNFTNYRDLQFELTLPDGITVVSEDDVIQVEAAKSSHKVAANAVASNKVRFVVYNDGNVDDNDNVIKLGDGIIVEIPVNVAAGFEGEVETSLDGILTSDDAATKSIEIGKGDFKFRAVLLGDVNDDGSVSLRDATWLAKSMIGEVSPFVEEVADFNNDNSKSLRDATAIAKSLITDTAAKENVFEAEDGFVNEVDPE